MDKWRIIVVDDEEDVHAVTGLALKRRMWKGRPFDLTGARSAADARKIMSSAEAFHVALVDVVMENDRAGLDLCDFIRSTQPRWTRIILRTGQPGAAPEETVLNEYDIDYYLAKAEVTQDRLYATTRSCLRSSQDVATILNVGDQLQRYIKAIQEDDNLDELVRSFQGALEFLESKFGVGLALFSELVESHKAECSGPLFKKLESDGAFKLSDVREAASSKKLIGASEFEPKQAGGVYLFPFTFVPPAPSSDKQKKGLLDSLYGFLGGSGRWVASGCIAAKFTEDAPAKSVAQIVYDLRLFAQNWKLAYQLLCTQKAISDAAAGVVW